MVKRKRNAPRLAESLAKWEKELVRGLKIAKGFERQRLSKRVRDADSEKTERLEREIVVLKSLDLHQAGHAHLCSSLLKVKGIAESPNLPMSIKPVPKPDLSEEERVALHNVTSALCNRKQVKDIIDEAVMGTCVALRVPMPEKKGKGKGKNGRPEQEDQADDIQENQPMSKIGIQPSKEEHAKQPNQLPESDEESSEESFQGFGSGTGDLEETEAEEKALSRFDGMLQGSSDEDESGDGVSEDKDLENSRARSIRGPADYFSGSSADEDSEPAMGSDFDSEAEEEAEEKQKSSEEEAIAPPPKKARSKPAQAIAAASGNSTFLPSLMGGYISGSESEASDIDVAPARKNRRGQKARQAIWEKKFKEKAKHLQNQKAGRDQGWDMKKGAVGEEDAGPWKRGIRNPFDRSKREAPKGVHPDRHANFSAHNGNITHQAAGPPRRGDGFQAQTRPTPKPKPKKDDEGPLHPSWQAAKLAKDASQKVTFQGKKVVFD
ncbi:Bud-site selection protein [Xylariales sp. AK1849]|nr:Bud-site selection protein [Xylariales sp. AK1849]